jgi:outer membrane protein assembly factor BamE (lipoprotein component of BamABCDE complex)
MKIKTGLMIGLLAGASVLLSACATQPKQQSTNPFTSGQVSMTLKQGVTTKAQVIQAFGAPNIVTQNAQGESEFIYQKNMQVQKSSSGGGYLTVILAGFSSNSSQSQQGSRTMTLIITFNKNDVVKSYKSMTTSF